MKRKIKEYMVTAKIVDEREAEVVEFGLDMLKTVLLGGVVVIGVGVIFGMFKETLLFIALLMTIRLLSVVLLQYVSLPWKVQSFFYLCGQGDDRVYVDSAVVWLRTDICHLRGDYE